MGKFISPKNILCCLFFHTFCAFVLIFTSHIVVYFDYFLEYLGCYIDNGPERLFDKTPGDYIPNELSPIACMMACGEAMAFRWH